MIYTMDSVYKGLLSYAATIAPSGIEIVEGENYGIRLDDPTGKNPSIAVNIEEIRDTALELGSASTAYVCSYTINAKSRFQRDALKQIVYSGLTYGAIPFYTAYDATNTPLDTAAIIGCAEIQTGIRIRDMPDWNSGRERFFWTSIVLFTIHSLIV